MEQLTVAERLAVRRLKRRAEKAAYEKLETEMLRQQLLLEATGRSRRRRRGRK